MIVATLLGPDVCKERTVLKLGATTQVRLYGDAYQVVLGCSATSGGDHDLHRHFDQGGHLVAAWYS